MIERNIPIVSASKFKFKLIFTSSGAEGPLLKISFRSNWPKNVTV